MKNSEAQHSISTLISSFEVQETIWVFFQERYEYTVANMRILGRNLWIHVSQCGLLKGPIFTDLYHSVIAVKSRQAENVSYQVLKIPGTNLLNPGGWISWWFWTWDLWIGNSTPYSVCYSRKRPWKKKLERSTWSTYVFEEKFKWIDGKWQTWL